MKLRALFKEFAIYGAGDILLRATAFITLPIYTRIFTPEDYGVWSFVITAVSLLSGILGLGSVSAYARFFFEAKTLSEKQLITSTWFGFLMLWSSGIVLLILPLTSIFSRWALEAEKYDTLFVLALLAAPIGLINTMCGQVLRNQFQAKLFTILNVCSTLLTIGFSLFAVIVLELGLIGLLGGALVAASVILPVRLWTARLMLRPKFSIAILQKLLAFGVPLVPSGLAYWIFASSDRFVLGKLSTFDQLGLYAVANSATSILALANSALGQAWSPHAIRMYEERPQLASVFFGQILTYILVGFGILSVGLSAFGYEVLIILSTPAFYSAALAIGPLALGFVALASTQITASGISITKQTQYFTIFSWLAALLNVGLNILLVPYWGIIAASWTTAISYLFLTIAYSIVSQRLWPIIYERRRIITVTLLTIGFVAATFLLPNPSLITGIAIKSIYCLIYVAMLAVFQVLDQREWHGMVRLIRTLRVRFIQEMA